MAASVLSVLRRGRGQWISVERLRSELQMGLTELQGKLAELRQMGYEVEEEPVRGLRLSGVGGRLSSELIENGLGTCYIGSKVLVYQVTNSTNNVAWAYMAEPGYDGLAVFAEQQRIGRGRLGRCWESAEGSSVLCSILLQDGGAWESRALTLLVGLSVAETIERVCQVAARIKWPNDVLVDGRKVAGTMIEGRSEGVRRAWVLGIGINCQQRAEEFSVALQGQAVSLREVTGQVVDRVALAQELLRCLEGWLESIRGGRLERLHDEWLSRCDNLGRRLVVMSDGRCFEGRVVDVCPERGLLMQLDDGALRMFDAATTTVNKP